MTDQKAKHTEGWEVVPDPEIPGYWTLRDTTTIGTWAALVDWWLVAYPTREAAEAAIPR